MCVPTTNIKTTVSEAPESNAILSLKSFWVHSSFHPLPTCAAKDQAVHSQYSYGNARHCENLAEMMNDWDKHLKSLVY